MDKISEILNNIKDRFSNPLIFSFVCAWLVFNWEITVALIWYDTKEIHAEGCVSIFEFIQDKLRRENSIWYPVIFAILYTVLIPFIKNLVKGLYTWVSKWGDSLEIKILNGGKIAIEKFLDLKSNYDKRTKVLEDIIENESKYLKGFEMVSTENLALKSEINETRQKLNETTAFYQKSNDVTILDGYWTCKISPNNIESRIKEYNIYISNGYYYMVDSFNTKKIKYMITYFNFNPNNQRIFFIKELSPDVINDA